MEVKPNINIDKEHENLIKDAKKYCNNLEAFKQKIDIFQENLKLLSDNYQIMDLSPPFDVLNKILMNFSYQLNALIEQVDNTILLMLKQNIKELNQNIELNSAIFDNLKESIAQEKEMIKDKNPYKLRSNKGNKSKINESKQDSNIFNFALDESYKQLYGYENESIIEIVEENRNEYNNSYNALNTMINDEPRINADIIVFASLIKKFADHLMELHKKLKDEFEKKAKEEEIDNIQKQNLFNIKNLYKNKKEKSLYISHILNENKDSDIENNIILIIESIIKRETKLKTMEVINIINYLGININCKKRQNYINLFLNKLFELCEINTIYIKNRKNCFHFANIMNAILLQNKSNIKTSYKIILLSNKIKYNNIFLYEIMRRKNIYLQTNKFWNKIILDCLINKINRFIEDNNNDKNSDNEKEKKEKDKIKEEFKIILKKLDIEKDISKNRKKLNYKQLKDLKQCFEKSTIITLSEIIPYMYSFLVIEEKIKEIIINYKDILGFDDSIKNYLENIILVQKLRIPHNNFSFPPRNEILLLCASKYLSNQEYKNIIISKKELYPNLRRNAFDIVFSNKYKAKDLSVDLQIYYLGEYLKIKKLKNSYNYNEIKQKINKSLFEKNKNNEKFTKEKEIIEHDLNRTKFIQDNPNKRESIESILFSCFFVVDKIKYYQGLNTVICFLYQLLNCEEDKSFNYFYALLFNTSYHLLFEDNLSLLNILFSVFEKIIKIYLPQFIYIIKNINIDVNYFCSSWFTTLFAGYFTIIDINNPPLLELFFLEKFCLNSWCSIFNLGLSIIELSLEKMKTLEKEELIKYIMNIIPEEKVFDNKNFEKYKTIYEKNEKWLNKLFVDKLIEITEFEYKNNYLINSEESF